jgi:hypothetical protein
MLQLLQLCEMLLRYIRAFLLKGHPLSVRSRAKRRRFLYSDVGQAFPVVMFQNGSDDPSLSSTEFFDFDSAELQDFLKRARRCRSS